MGPSQSLHASFVLHIFLVLDTSLSLSFSLLDRLLTEHSPPGCLPVLQPTFLFCLITFSHLDFILFHGLLSGNVNHRFSFMIMSFTVGLHSNLPVKSLSHPWGVWVVLCLRVYLGWFLTGWLAPAPRNTLSVFLLIHSLLACCCSVSIEAQLNASISSSNGFFIVIIIKMHYAACKEVACACECVGVFCLLYWDKWRRRSN